MSTVNATVQTIRTITLDETVENHGTCTVTFNADGTVTVNLDPTVGAPLSIAFTGEGYAKFLQRQVATP